MPKVITTAKTLDGLRHGKRNQTITPTEVANLIATVDELTATIKAARELAYQFVSEATYASDKKIRTEANLFVGRAMKVEELVK